jgi:2-hydroxy-6-oxonona-2,4-dienedioate hydrolase
LGLEATGAGVLDCVFFVKGGKLMIETMERRREVQPLPRRRKPWLGILLALTAAATVLPVYASYASDLHAAQARLATGSKIIDTNCGPLEYATLGEGSPVLVLHGTSGGWDQGIAAARGLVAQGFQLIAPSRFGYLGTPLPPDSLPPAEAEAWICLLDALQLQRVPVISYSAGAAPALQLALRHPERITAAVFFVPGGSVRPVLRRGRIRRVCCWMLYIGLTFPCGWS